MRMRGSATCMHDTVLECGLMGCGRVRGYRWYDRKSGLLKYRG